MGELDYQLALLLQHQFEQELKRPKEHSGDFQLAQTLQEVFTKENEIDIPQQNLVYANKSHKKNGLNSSKSLTDPSWEVIDPTPDIHVLFMAFNERFFWNKLLAVCVSWSKRMTSCAGICSYQGRGGMCSITLSEPLLKLRPRKDLVETLLHEMIHAYLFVTRSNRDRDGHGPEFHKHMFRINGEAGTNITVYHDFHDEVRLYQQHWWRCNGPCQKRKPFFGMVRRSVNRAPGPQDRWWGEHSRSCGGKFIKVKEPEKPIKKKESNETKQKSDSGENKSKTDIRHYIPPISKPNVTKPMSNIHTISNTSDHSSKISTVIPSKVTNIFGFTNLNGSSNHNSSSSELNKGGFKGTVGNNTNTIVVNKKPSTITKNDTLPNSSLSKPSDIGRTLSESAVKKNSLDYSAVRNHWINKFNTNTSQSVKRTISQDVAGSPTKIPKISTNQHTITNHVPHKNDNAECPVCFRKVPMIDLNSHLDSCLATPQFNVTKECIICGKQMSSSEYEEHVVKCSGENFGDDIFENTTEDTTKCSFCGKNVATINYGHHVGTCSSQYLQKNISSIVTDLTGDDSEGRKCSVCDKTVPIVNYDSHAEQCLLKIYDNIEATYGNNDEHVDCLACGNKIKRSELDSHLEDCMSLSQVFEDDNKPQEEEITCDNYKENKYNCPLCMELVLEANMNAHIDICLNSVNNNSSQVERNKNLLVESLLQDDF